MAQDVKWSARLKKNGGQREECAPWEMPGMGEKAPQRDPEGHWGRVLGHLQAVNAADRQGLRKARKMLARLGGR